MKALKGLLHNLQNAFTKCTKKDLLKLNRNE